MRGFLSPKSTPSPAAGGTLPMTVGSGHQSSLGLCSRANPSLTLELSAGALIPAAPWLLPPQLSETRMVQMFFHILFKALEEPF